MSSNAEIAQEIEGVVDAWWENNQVPVLLSKLGSLLSPETQRLVRDEKIGLKRFIALYSPGIRLLEMGRHGGGGAPNEETIEFTDEELSKIFENKRKLEDVDRIPSYDVLVWRAFRTPLSPGERRFLKIDPDDRIELRQMEAPEEAPEEPTYFEVKADDLSHLQGNLPATARDVHNAIKAWAEGKTDFNNLIKSHEHRGLNAKAKLMDRQVGLDVDGIIANLRGFTKDELARISIPADVILSFLERNRK